MGGCGSLEPGIPEAQGINYLQHLAIHRFPIAAFPHDCLASPIPILFFPKVINN